MIDPISGDKCKCGCNRNVTIFRGKPRDYIHGHNTKVSLTDKYTIHPGGCWLWTWHKNHKGYGLIFHDGITEIAHRYMYKLHKGSIPEGLQLDHTCHVRSCVNPDHLNPVTQSENNKTRKKYKWSTWR
jgi:hypothetical protein